MPKTSNMKKIYLITLFSVSILFSFAQRINKVTISNNGTATAIGFLLDQNVIINIKQDGILGEWGVDKYVDRGAAQSSQRPLEAFDGKVDYYTQNEDEAFRGKLKYIGRTLITYYASTDKAYLVGKIKSVGPLKFDYFSNYDDAMLSGKMKTAGPMNLSYYTSFENESIRGKVKSAGTVQLTYFGSLDDKSISGKVKSVNGNTFIYATSQEQDYPKGSLKFGMQIQVVNGITYTVRN